MRLTEEFHFTCPCGRNHVRATAEPFRCDCGRLQEIIWTQEYMTVESGAMKCL